MSMEICSPTDFSVTDNANDLNEPSTDPPDSTHVVPKPYSVNDLTIDVTELLNIQNDTSDDSNSSPDTCNKSHEVIITTQAHEKSLDKFATFPCSTHDDNTKSVDTSSFHSISMITHLKVVFAMKGSREKRGMAPLEKLRVKWAPDVYDPIPTIQFPLQCHML